MSPFYLYLHFCVLEILSKLLKQFIKYIYVCFGHEINPHFQILRYAEFSLNLVFRGTSDFDQSVKDSWVNQCQCVGLQADMTQVVEEVNDKHMGPWAEACREGGVENTPLSPYIQQELLDNKHLHLSNNKLKSTGFTLAHPILTKQALQEVGFFLMSVIRVMWGIEHFNNF